MRRSRLVAIADPMRFRRPLPWIMMAIALLLVCGIMRTGNGSQGATAELREKAVAALKKLGGKVYRDETEPSKPVLGVDLDNTPATDEARALLELFPDLQMLSLTEKPGYGLPL